MLSRNTLLSWVVAINQLLSPTMAHAQNMNEEINRLLWISQSDTFHPKDCNSCHGQHTDIALPKVTNRIIQSWQAQWLAVDKSKAEKIAREQIWLRQLFWNKCFHEEVWLNDDSSHGTRLWWLGAKPGENATEARNGDTMITPTTKDGITTTHRAVIKTLPIGKNPETWLDTYEVLLEYLQGKHAGDVWRLRHTQNWGVGCVVSDKPKSLM